VGELHDVDQANVPFAALDPADVIAVQFRQLRELLLRETAFYSQFAEASSESDSGIGVSHLAILRT
jgi:hypothetical protein